MNMPGAFLILGPPGSGKGTQARLLADHFGVPHISLGAILRAELAKGARLGVEASQYMAAGEPVPVDLMRRVLGGRLAYADAAAGFIGDGLVRTVEQASALDTLIATLGMDWRAVFHLDTPDNEIQVRLSSRRICPQCERIYSLSTTQRMSAMTCCEDGQLLISRPDDTEPIIKGRLRSHQNTLPAILAHYQAAGVLIRIDGMQAAFPIHADILQRIR
jgi:adenylate kinase